MAGVVATLAFLIVLTGCRAAERATETGDGDTLPAVVLPNLSDASDTFRQQVQQRYDIAQKTGDASAYGELGKLLLAAEYFDAAAPPLLHAQALAPAEFRWPYYLGHVYRQRSDWRRAAAAFERALQIRADEVATLVWLGEVRLAQNESEAAALAFERAATVDPRANAAWFGLGRAALARQDYRRAIDALERALTQDAQASAIRYPLSAAYRAVGETAKADAHLAQRGDVQPGMPDPLLREVETLLESAAAYEVRAREALERGDWEGTIEASRAGIPLASGTPSVEAALRHRLGTALAQTGRSTEAFQEFEHAVQLDPQFARGHYSLGIMLSAADRPREAIERLSMAIKLNPGYLEARMALGEILLATGRPAEALAQYDAALELAPDLAPAREGRAAALRQRRQ